MPITETEVPGEREDTRGWKPHSYWTCYERNLIYLSIEVGLSCFELENVQSEPWVQFFLQQKVPMNSILRSPEGLVAEKIAFFDYVYY